MTGGTQTSAGPMKGKGAGPAEHHVHPPARELLLLAVDHGWNALLNHSTDSGGAPFITVKARREAAPHAVEVTWHTRDTGTYRLWYASVGINLGRRDVTLKAAREAVTS